MAYNNPPWTPEMDAEAVEFYQKLEAEKYDGDVDDIGTVRWSSEWRMHRGNGMNTLDATVAVFMSIDAIRAGQPPPTTPPGPYDVPWAPEMDAECEPFCTDLEALYQEYQNRSVDETGWVRWSSDFRIARANGLSYDLAWAKIKREILNIWGVQPDVEQCPVPIHGLLRRVHNLLADDNGFVTPLFSSEFNLLRVRKFDHERYLRLLSDLVTNRLQGSRVFTSVGGWVGFWDNAEVCATTFTKWHFSRESGHLRPATDPDGRPMYGPTLEGWPDYDEQFYGLCEDFARRKLRLHVTAGDVQIIMPNLDVEMQHHRRVASIANSVDPEVIALYEIRNEYPMNSPQGGTAFDINNMGRIIVEVKAILPRVLCGLGAALSEEPEDLRESTRYSDVCFQHTSRVPFELCLKRTLGLRYWEGNWGAFDWPFVNGEPKPMNIPPFGDGVGDDGYAPTDRVDQLIALHAMIAITSQAGNLFTGASVKLQAYPSDMPGYSEIPLMLEQHVPEDVATWGRATAGRGAILYFTKDDRFLASTDENWDTTPPRLVAEWTMYTGRGTQIEVLHGTGSPPQRRTGFIVGTFA